MDLFAGTAAYYDHFRPGIPDEVRDTILHAVKAPVALLDLGTGTGRVLEQFAPYFSDIIAVEPDLEMQKMAHKRLMAYPVHFENYTAENVKLPQDWHASLATICRAFHWMDRNVVLRKLESVIAPDGVVAIFYDQSFWDLDEPWAAAARQTIQHFLGPERETAQGTYQGPSRPFTHDLAASAFSVVNKYEIPVVRSWTADQIIGYLYSTSFASQEMLGEHAERFEQVLRRELKGLSPNDTFTEHNRFTILLARRP